MSNTQKTLLERIKASAEILNGFGCGDRWRAEPLKASIEGTWSIKRGTFGMADQLADVFAKVNYGEHDTQDAQGVAKAMVEARNTSRHLLTEAAAEIERLQAEVDRLTQVVDQAIKFANIRVMKFFGPCEPRLGSDLNGSIASKFPELYAELQSREAMQAAIDYAKDKS
jgi:hypothetical protein